MIINLYGRDINLGESPSDLCQKRWAGYYSPEPETVEWIESLPVGDVFYDIGASVGTHTIRAAVRGLKVFAFEPQEILVNELRATARRNSLSIYVEATPLSYKRTVGMLGRGRSTHTFYPNPDGKLTSTSLNLLSQRLPKPDHIKLDVDGNELDILKGGSKVLGGIKSILVEIDPKIPRHMMIPDLLVGYGLLCSPKQVMRDMISSGKYKGTANWIFRRMA